MSVSEALRAGLVMKVKSRAPCRSTWSFVRFVALYPADDAETLPRSHSADRNKQFARRGYWVTRMSAGSRLALISLLDFARMTSLEKGKGTHMRTYHCFYDLLRSEIDYFWIFTSLNRSPRKLYNVGNRFCEKRFEYCTIYRYNQIARNLFFILYLKNYCITM